MSGMMWLACVSSRCQVVMLVVELLYTIMCVVVLLVLLFQLTTVAVGIELWGWCLDVMWLLG